MMKANKLLLIIETTVYAVLSVVLLLLYFYNEFSKSIISLIYIITLILTFGYFFLIETILKKYDVAVHYKMKKEFYKPTNITTPHKTKRTGLIKVIILWVAYLAFIALLKYTGILNWQLFCAGAYFMFLLNSFFTRKLCLLSAIILHNKNNCCKHCGINGWDGAIFASALIFAPTISVITTIINWIIIIIAFLKLIEWEYLYHKYPYRFYPETNQSLGCEYCIKRCKYSTKPF